MRAMLRIGDSALMVVEEAPEWNVLGPKSLIGSPVTLQLEVKDVATTVAQAVCAGAKITRPRGQVSRGDPHVHLEDPFGHLWAVVNTNAARAAREAVSESVGNGSE